MAITVKVNGKTVTEGRKTKTSWDDAVNAYAEMFGEVAEHDYFRDLYYQYGKNWKQYDGFADFLRYYTA